MAADSALWLAIVVAGAAAFSVVDLTQVEARTLVIYTTPALRDVLEGLVLPTFEDATGIEAQPVYMTASAQYHRVLLSRERPEADIFLHASPLFIEKGNAEGTFQPLGAEQDLLRSRARVTADGPVWQAFAWSPLVTVHAQGSPNPDLALADLEWGLPHPLLSNNGVYAALLFEQVDPAAGSRAVANAVVQPTNARATIGGVADGSFDVTLGYEAVAQYYLGRGAQIEYDVPLVGGRNVTTPVLFSVGHVKDNVHAGAEAFIDHLFSPAVQEGLGRFNFRPTVEGHPGPRQGVDLAGAEVLDYDWARWRELEARLPAYEVKA